MGNYDMGESATQDVLGRKASASRRAFEARVMSPAKALRRALSRTADALWELALVTQGVQQEILDHDGCLEVLAPGHLLILMEGPEGARGLVSVDREIMTGLIEIQTIAKVTRMPIEDRPLTPTDAAMMAPLLDGALDLFEANLDGNPDLAQLRGFRFGALVEDSRTAGLLIEAASFRAFRVTLDLEAGTRRGDIRIILPIRDITRAPDPEADLRPGPHEPRLMLVPARIETVLARIRLPLGKANALRPGDLLELPAMAHEKAELIAPRGHRLAGGRLGQMNGFRAIRLNLPAGIRAAKTSEVLPEEEPPVAKDQPRRPAPALSLAAPQGAAPDEQAESLPDLPALDFGSAFSDGEDFDIDAALFGDDADGAQSSE